MDNKISPEVLDQVVSLFTDGGVVGVNPSPLAGTWAWCGVNAAGTRVIERGGYVVSLPGFPWTNNWAEQVALTLALEAMPDGWSGLVCSDSMIALGRIFQGWRTKNLPEEITRRSRAAVARLGKIETRLLQGHPTKKDLAAGIGAKRGFPVSIHNCWADKECGRQSQLFRLHQAAQTDSNQES